MEESRPGKRNLATDGYAQRRAGPPTMAAQRKEDNGKSLPSAPPSAHRATEAGLFLAAGTARDTFAKNLMS